MGDEMDIRCHSIQLIWAANTMPKLRKLFSCLPSRCKSDENAVIGSNTQAASAPAPIARCQQPQSALNTPPTTTTNGPLTDLGEGISTENVNDMSIAYKDFLGRVQGQTTEVSAKHAVNALALVCEHFTAHSGKITYKNFIVNTLFEIAKNRYTLASLTDFLNETCQSTHIDSGKILRALEDHQIREKRRAQDSTLQVAWALQQELDLFAQSKNTDEDPISTWIPRDNNPQKTIDILINQRPKALGDALANLIGEQLCE